MRMLVRNSGWLVLAMLMATCVAALRYVSQMPEPAGTNWWIFAAYGWVGIAMHEAGHALAGTLAGFELSVFRVTGFELRREGALQIRWFARLGGGYLGVPPVCTNLWMRQLAIVAGGPLANLAAFAFCWFALVYGRWPAGMFEFLHGLMTFSLFSAAVNLAPLNLGNSKTDGRLLWDAMFDKEVAQHTMMRLYGAERATT